MKKFYLASPYGFAELMKPGYETFKARLRTVVDIRCPWEEQPGVLTVLSVGSLNACAIQDCDGLIAIVDGSDVDSGTAAEVGFAYALDIPTFGFRSDLRQAGNIPGATVNAQVQYFLSGGIYTSVETLLDRLKGEN